MPTLINRVSAVIRPTVAIIAAHVSSAISTTHIGGKARK